MEEKEKDFEDRYIEAQKEIRNEISKLRTEFNTKIGQVEQKIEDVKDESTKALIKYLSENRK